MSTTEDTSAIDEKKAEESGTSTTSPDFKGFITNYLLSIIFTIGIPIFIIGGLGLYTTKVAQANILPDDIELAPYTIFDRNVNPIPVDMNIMRPSFFSENKDTLSQKAIFNSQEYLDSFNNSFLCSLKNSADPNAGLFANGSLYFSFIYDNLFAKNFLAINTIFFYLSYLPESAIMFLYGLFGIFLWLGLYFFNVCISIFYHIINIPQLFRTTNKETKKWEAAEHISFFRLMKLILFFFLWIPLGFLSAFIMPAFFTIYGLISPLFATYKLKQSSGNQKSLNIFDFIKDTFAYKKLFFFILATLSLFTNGSKYLGSNAIVGIVFAVIFAYFMGLYTNEMPEYGVDGFTFKIKQNMKQATVDAINLKDPKLVEICQRIPIDDEKLERMIKGIRPRELTKPTEIGGDIDNDDTIEIQNAVPIKEKITPSAPPVDKSFDDNITPSAPLIDNSEVMPKPKVIPKTELIPKSRNELLREELEQLKNQSSNLAQDKQWGIASQSDYDDIQRKIAQIESELQMQTGGKKQKNKYVNNSKKYNLRLV